MRDIQVLTRRGRLRFSVVLYAGVAMVALAGAHSAAFAQEADAGDTEEVIVTAERRSTRLQSTPLSVGVVGGRELQEQNLSLLRDLSGSVASLQVPASKTPSLSYLFVRGIGTTSPTYNGAVGIYVDDVYQARVINSGVFGLPDVERIEVLRGPQGTLYGQNTSAGAIRIISRTPGDYWTGSVSLAAGNHNQRNVSLYAGGPLSERVSASVAVAHEHVGGTTWNATLNKHVDAVRTTQGRVKLHYRPVSERGPTATLSVYFLNDQSDNGSSIPLNVPNPDPRVTYENLDLRIDNKNLLASLTVDQPLTDRLVLKSITGYREFNNDPDPWSADGLASDLFSWQLNLDQQQISQELQLQGDYGRLTFTVGGIYYHERFIADRPNVTYGNRAGSLSKTVTDSFGLYGQGRYALTEKLGVTAGLRYYKQEDEYDNQGYVSDANFAYVSPTYTLKGLKGDWDGLTPKIGVDYQFSDRAFGYASITVGQKSGGYNPVATVAEVAAIPTSPEEVIAYEAGVKLGTGRRYQLNATVFYNDFRDYQTILANAVINGQVVSGSVTINAEKAETYGVEIEALARPAERLELRLAATALDASFVDFDFNVLGGSVNYNGNWLPYASKINVGASAAYRLPLGSAGDLRLRGEVKYTSKAYTTIQNNVEIPEQTYANIDAVYTTADGRWSGVLRVRNLFDETYAIGGLPRTSSLPGILTASYNQPRLVSFGLTYNF